MFSCLMIFNKSDDGKVISCTMFNILILVVKCFGENIIEIVEVFKEVINEYKVCMEFGVDVVIFNDMFEDIKVSVMDFENNIILGMIFVVVILFFFMGGVCNVLMVLISVLFLMFILFIVFDMLGIMFNMVVFFSLMFVFGMFVDNVIVIVENIYCYVSEGKLFY